VVQALLDFVARVSIVFTVFSSLHSNHLSLFLPASSTCGTYPYCYSYQYYGDLTLGGLIGVIIGSIVACCLLIACCIHLTKRRQRAAGVPIAYSPTSYNNPGAYQAPPPGPYNYPK
jgi:hypothetical protein